MIARLDFMALTFATGQVSFDFILRDEVSIISWVLFAITFTVWVFRVMDFVVNYFHSKKLPVFYRQLRENVVNYPYPNIAQKCSSSS